MSTIFQFILPDSGLSRILQMHPLTNAWSDIVEPLSFTDDSILITGSEIRNHKKFKILNSFY